MKSYSVGRDPSCNIVLYDNTDVVSRRHAIINVAPSGKITITDMSSNGTYVNGIRITSNVPVPVTRKDNVSFAHVAKLDWNQVPREMGWLRYLIGAIAAILIVCITVAVLHYCDRNKTDQGNEVVPAAVEQADTVKQDTTKQDTTKKEAPEAKKDSTKAVQNPNAGKAEAQKQQPKQQPKQTEKQQPKQGDKQQAKQGDKQGEKQGEKPKTEKPKGDKPANPAKPDDPYIPR